MDRVIARPLCTPHDTVLHAPLCCKNITPLNIFFNFSTGYFSINRFYLFFAINNLIFDQFCTPIWSFLFTPFPCTLGDLNSNSSWGKKIEKISIVIPKPEGVCFYVISDSYLTPPVTCLSIILSRRMKNENFFFNCFFPSVMSLYARKYWLCHGWIALKDHSYS